MNLKLTFAFLCAAAFQTRFAQQSHAETGRECVVLIHGLGRSSLSMKRLEWTLARAGYQVVNVSYPSRRFGIEQLAENYLHKAVVAIPGEPRKIHFITHSMGGIILRQYLSCHSIENLGAVTMLAPPNRGSEIVDALKKNRVGRWILGPAGCQLGTGAEDLPNRLGPVRCNAGVIAGTRSFNPWFSLLLSGPDDGKVAVANTKVEGMKDFRAIPSSHTWILWREITIQHVLMFLQKGRF
jgi:pimeloyl-ACP methyl ester carboxylesterase